MAFVIAALKRARSGAYTARKGIPKDVQEEYARLYGMRWEAKLTLPAQLKHQEAKARHGEWVAEVEARIAAIRAKQRGERQSLTQRQATALAGEWYRWFVGQREENPGSPVRWEEAFSDFVGELEQYAPEETRVYPWKDLDWAKSPDVRAGVRPELAKRARADAFLASRGVALSDDAYRLFLDKLVDEYIEAALLLQRRAQGDYSPDDHLDELPAFKPVPKPHNEADISPWALFEAWVEARQPSAASVDRWRAVFLALNELVQGGAAGAITPDEAQRWAEALVTPKRSPRTVKEVWVNAAHTVFQWGTNTRKLSVNPFADVKIAVPRKVRTRERDFRPEEAARILTGSLGITDTTRAFNAAKRWVPWICAYTGARAGEITQLRGEDVVKREGHWALQITPEAGTVKTGEVRVVPLHEHLLAQGFLDFVHRKGKGPLFYDPNSKSKAKTKDATNPAKPRPVKQRERLAVWVREIGVTDKAIQPNHAWRHTFKRLADRNGISERVSDAITGHSPATVGRSYGAPSVDDMAKALARFPRYDTRRTSPAEMHSGKGTGLHNRKQVRS